MRCIRFRARRSAVRMDRAEPLTLPKTVPASMASPSEAVHETSRSESTALKTRSATARPASVPSAFARNRAVACLPAAMVASVVTSPRPTSSASARAIRAPRSSAMESGMCSIDWSLWDLGFGIWDLGCRISDLGLEMSRFVLGAWKLVPGNWCLEFGALISPSPFSLSNGVPEYPAELTLQRPPPQKRRRKIYSKRRRGWLSGPESGARV